MSLRDRLRARSRPTATHDLRVEDDTAARNELAAALQDGAPERIEAAQTALQTCYETLHLTALPPADMEALIAAHPAPGGSDSAWNPATFIPALLVACVGGDATEDDWAEWTTKGPLSVGESRDLLNAVLAVNYRTPDLSVGKGSPPTRS